MISSDITDKEVTMSDLLIRDVPDDVLAALDKHAVRLGLSRTEYVRRRLAQDAHTATVNVTTADWRRIADDLADLGDAEVMGQAWR
ncbi:antitoxin VapB2 [Mycolicibacterium madagascariense]|uniref:Antitoxin VapB2 n=2 Tax=Mycolicibacterium madagascariense TaxID=212765 RepID=A0A7I7XID4_9MYCO|nr:antitoxin VapB2 [Mycolicibacterium madagascariense]